MKYLVIDRHNQEVIGTYQTLKRASNKVDKLDNEYGGYRYYHIRSDFYEMQNEKSFSDMYEINND